jgi:hypothetical protein
MPVMFCGCVVASSINCHSGSASVSQATNPKPRYQFPFHTRTNGVQYQDEKFGPGMRMHNLLRRKPQEPARARCTICENVKAA